MIVEDGAPQPAAAAASPAAAGSGAVAVGHIVGTAAIAAAVAGDPIAAVGSVTAAADTTGSSGPTQGLSQVVSSARGDAGAATEKTSSAVLSGDSADVGTAAATTTAEPAVSPRIVGEPLSPIRAAAVARTDSPLSVAAQADTAIRDATSAGTLTAAASVRALLPAVAALGDIARERAADEREIGRRRDEHGTPQPAAAAAGPALRGVATIAPLGHAALERQVLQRQAAGIVPVREDGEQPQGRRGGEALDGDSRIDGRADDGGVGPGRDRQGGLADGSVADLDQGDDARAVPDVLAG